MSNLQITGKITKVLPIENGTSKAGKDWQKIRFIVQTTEDYNNIYCFDIFGAEKVENFTKFNNEGDEVTVKFNVDCNDYKGKYFTNLNAWRVEKGSEPMETPQNQPQEEAEDDLPF